MPSDAITRILFNQEEDTGGIINAQEQVDNEPSASLARILGGGDAFAPPPPAFPQMDLSQSTSREPKEGLLLAGAIEGWKSIKRGEILEKAREGDIPFGEAMDEIKFSGLAPKYKSAGLSFNPIKLAKTALFTAGQFAGQYASAIWDAKEEALAGAATGAGIGAIGGGGAGAIPGAITGGMWGARVGVFRNIWNATSGAMYQEMVDNNVDHETAAHTAGVFGLGSALLELAQLNTLGTVASKGLNLLSRKGAEEALEAAVAKESIKKIIAKSAAKKALKGATQEAEQEAAQQLIEEFGKIFAERVDGDVKEKTSFLDAFKSALAAGGETFLGAGLIGGGFGAIGYARGAGMLNQAEIDFSQEYNIPDYGTMPENQLATPYAPISEGMINAIKAVSRDMDTTKAMAEGMFGKKLSDLEEIEGNALRLILSTTPSTFEYKPITEPSMEEIDNQRKQTPDMSDDDIIRSSVIKQAINSLAGIANSRDVHSATANKAGAKLIEIIKNKATGQGKIDLFNKDIQEITEAARLEAQPLVLGETLGFWKDKMAQAAKQKKAEPKTTKLGQTVDWIRNNAPAEIDNMLSSVENLSAKLSRLAGTDFAKDMFSKFVESQDKEDYLAVNFRKPLEGAFTALSTSEANTPVMEMIVGGERHNFSPDNLALIYAVSKMTDGKGSRTSPGGGITLLEEQGFTPSQIAIIGEKMDSPEMSQYKQAADNMLEAMGGMWESVAKTYNSITGKKLGRRKVYMPVNFLEASSKDAVKESETAGQFAVLNEVDENTDELTKSFLRSQRTGDPRKIRNYSLHSAVSTYMDDVAQYMAFAPLMHDLKRMFDDKNFTDKLKREYGRTEVNRLLRDIDDIRTGGAQYKKHVLDNVMHRLIAMQVRAVLAYPTVWIGQFSGVFPAVTQVEGGMKALGRQTRMFAADPINGFKQYLKDVKDIPWFNKRSGRNQSDYERIILRGEAKTRTLPKNVGLRKAMIAAKKADKLAAQITTFADLFPNYIAYKAMVDAETRRGVSPEKAHTTAIEALIKSQPTQDQISKANLFRQQGFFVEAMTRLKQQDNKSWNLIKESVELINEGGIDKVSRAKRILLGQALNKLVWIGSTTMMTGLLSALGGAVGGSDEDPREKMKRSAAYRTIQSVTGFMPGLDIVADLMSGMITQGRPQLSVFNPLAEGPDVAGSFGKVGLKLAGQKKAPISGKEVGDITQADIRNVLQFGVPRMYAEPIANIFGAKGKKKSLRQAYSAARRKI